MIQKVEVSASSMDLTEDINRYIEKKISRLDRFMTRHAKKSAHASVKLKAEKAKKNNKFTAEVILKLPHETMTAKESTLNIFAAIDIVEAKLQNQLRKYKEQAQSYRTPKKNVMSKIKKLADKDFWGSQN